MWEWVNKSNDTGQSVKSTQPELQSKLFAIGQSPGRKMIIPHYEAIVCWTKSILWIHK